MKRCGQERAWGDSTSNGRGHKQQQIAWAQQPAAAVDPDGAQCQAAWAQYYADQAAQAQNTDAATTAQTQQEAQAQHQACDAYYAQQQAQNAYQVPAPPLAKQFSPPPSLEARIFPYEPQMQYFQQQQSAAPHVGWQHDQQQQQQQHEGYGSLAGLPQMPHGFATPGIPPPPDVACSEESAAAQQQQQQQQQQMMTTYNQYGDGAAATLPPLPPTATHIDGMAKRAPISRLPHGVDIVHGSTNADDCAQLVPLRIGLAIKSGGAKQAAPAEGVATWLEETFECQVYGSNDFSQNSGTPVLDVADSARSGDQVKYALAWAHFSTTVLAAFPTPGGTKLHDFTRGGRGCLSQEYELGASATRETIALAGHVLRKRDRRAGPPSMTKLKNWITHELCVEALAKAFEVAYPGLEQQREAKTVENKSSDLYLPSLHTHIEIKTWVWAGSNKHQHEGFQSSTESMYVLVFRYGTASISLRSLGAVNSGRGMDQSVKCRLELLANVMVLPVFMRWGEHLIRHSLLVKEKREAGCKGTESVYCQKTWPSVDSHLRFQYLQRGGGEYGGGDTRQQQQPQKHSVHPSRLQLRQEQEQQQQQQKPSESHPSTTIPLSPSMRMAVGGAPPPGVGLLPPPGIAPPPGMALLSTHKQEMPHPQQQQQYTPFDPTGSSGGTGPVQNWQQPLSPPNYPPPPSQAPPQQQQQYAPFDPTGSSGGTGPVQNWQQPLPPPNYPPPPSQAPPQQQQQYAPFDPTGSSGGTGPVQNWQQPLPPPNYPPPPSQAPMSCRGGVDSSGGRGMGGKGQWWQQQQQQPPPLPPPPGLPGRSTSRLDWQQYSKSPPPRAGLGASGRGQGHSGGGWRGRGDGGD